MILKQGSGATIEGDFVLDDGELGIEGALFFRSHPKSDHYARITIAGNLTRDPKELNADTSTYASGIAVNRKHGDHDETYFFDVIVRNRLGEIVSEYLRRGDGALFEGDLTLRTYTDKDDHEKSSPQVNATKMMMLPSPKKNGEDKAVNGNGRTQAGSKAHGARGNGQPRGNGNGQTGAPATVVRTPPRAARPGKPLQTKPPRAPARPRTSGKALRPHITASDTEARRIARRAFFFYCLQRMDMAPRLPKPTFDPTSDVARLARAVDFWRHLLSECFDYRDDATEALRNLLYAAGIRSGSVIAGDVTITLSPTTILWCKCHQGPLEACPDTTKGAIEAVALQGEPYLRISRDLRSSASHTARSPTRRSCGQTPTASPHRHGRATPCRRL